MNYTYKQVAEIFDSVVNSYKVNGYKESYLASFNSKISRFSHASMTKDHHKTDIVMSSNLSPKSCNGHSLLCLNINIRETNNNVVTDDYNLIHLYKINNNYYTTDIDFVKESRDKSIRRTVLNLIGNSYICPLDICKMSFKLKIYLKNKICNKLDAQGRTHDFIIKDVYFRHSDNKRELVVVIRHSDNSHTEAITL